MNLKKIKILSIFLTFGLSVLFHFAYDIFPNFLTATIFPVNESIWEHMKLLYFGILFYSIIEYFILKKNDIDTHNFLLSVFISSFLSVIIYLIIYLPIYNIIGENMAVSIILLAVVIIIVNIISYYILKQNRIYAYSNIISIIFIFIGYIIFTYLTYNPIKNYIFYDKKEHKYGIDQYVINE